MKLPPPAVALLVVVSLAFGALSTVAMLEHGYLGILLPHFQSSAGLQVLVDLVIALLLVMAWMVIDARRTGRTVWPWLVLTLLAGSFGPLGYLLTGVLRDRRRAPGLAAGAR
ncbi:MAG: DUF2834 domain-containing protein [Burkholderiaceae bacterium]